MKSPLKLPELATGFALIAMSQLALASPPTSIPEPGTMSLIAGGAVVAVIGRRLRRNK